MPIIATDPETTDEFERMASQLVASADMASDKLTTAIISCKRSGHQARERLWADLEPIFLETLRAVPDAMVADVDDPTLSLRQRWSRVVCSVALHLFDATCPFDREPKRVVKERHHLALLLRGKGMKKLLEVGSNYEGEV